MNLIDMLDKLSEMGFRWKISGNKSGYVFEVEGKICNHTHYSMNEGNNLTNLVYITLLDINRRLKDGE